MAGGRYGWLALVYWSALLGCGASSTDVKPESVVETAGSAPDLISIGSGGDNCASADDGGSSAMIQGGTAGADAPGPVALCLYPDQIPHNWSPPVACYGASTCAMGQLGQFVFEGCRYELLDATAYDVDMFRGGHSPCCYRSMLIGCP
ncbi:MAG: hypothetical protein WDO69_34070 [Pseudomonadota bacterium]